MSFRLRKGWLNAAAAARTPKYGTGLMAYWKQGWNEIPEVMGSGFYGLIGFIGIIYVGIRNHREDRGNHRFKNIYLIYRPDDERIERLKRFEDSPPVTNTPSGMSGMCG